MRRHHNQRAALGRISQLLVAAGTLLSASCHREDAGGPIEVTAIFGEPGADPGQYAKPRAIDADASTLWIVERDVARVQRIDAETGRPLGGWRLEQYQLGKPTGVTVWIPQDKGPDEYLFVPDTHYHRVQVYRVPRAPVPISMPPEKVAEFGSYGEGPGQFIYPTDVVVIPNPAGDGVARLFISEYGGHDRINVYDRVDATQPGAGGEYRFATSFGAFGIAGEDAAAEAAGRVFFNRPQSMELDRTTNELVITDACNHRVGRFTLDGELRGWIGGAPGSPKKDPQSPEFLYPYGLSLLGDGTALVAEFGGARLQRIDLSTGRSIATLGKAGRGPGELSSPWGVTRRAGHVYVLDTGNNRVQVFDQPKLRHTRGEAGSPSRLARGGGPR